MNTIEFFIQLFHSFLFLYILQQSQEEIENTIENMIPTNMRKLRWFYTSAEALHHLKKKTCRRLDSTSGTAKCASPFVPRHSTRRMTMDAKYREEMKAFLQMSTECNQSCCPFCPSDSNKCDGVACTNNNTVETGGNDKSNLGTEQVQDLDQNNDSKVFLSENNLDKSSKDIITNDEQQNRIHLETQDLNGDVFDDIKDENDVHEKNTELGREPNKMGEKI